MRYEAEWLLECMLLRCKSPAAYKHLRKTQIIPLPHEDTLRRLIRGMSCHFGFNNMAFDAIKRAMEDKPLSERCIILSFDEMAIQAALEFNTESLAFDGFTRTSDDPISNRESISMAEEELSDECLHNPAPVFKKNVTVESLADHALFFMLRTINKTKANWIQPCGVFGSRSASPGGDLFQLMLACIIRCEVFGARVIAIVCDGAQGNKTVWQKSGVGITAKGQITSSSSTEKQSNNDSIDSGNVSMENFSVDLDFNKDAIEIFGDLSEMDTSSLDSACEDLEHSNDFGETVKNFM